MDFLARLRPCSFFNHVATSAAVFQRHDSISVIQAGSFDDACLERNQDWPNASLAILFAASRR
jgi:hypothetical protein